MVKTLKVKCPTCDGTGDVHSHNPTCWTCRGTGKCTPKEAAESERLERIIEKNIPKRW